jgi:hypothetical protein
MNRAAELSSDSDNAQSECANWLVTEIQLLIVHVACASAAPMTTSAIAAYVKPDRDWILQCYRAVCDNKIGGEKDVPAASAT